MPDWDLPKANVRTKSTASYRMEKAANSISAEPPRAGSCPAEILLLFIFSQRMSMNWRELWVARPRTSYGVCMNLVSPIRTKRWFALGGGRGSTSGVSRPPDVALWQWLQTSAWHHVFRKRTCRAYLMSGQ